MHHMNWCVSSTRPKGIVLLSFHGDFAVKVSQMSEFWLDHTEEGKLVGDTIVLGRAIRDWRIEHFAGDRAEMAAFETALWDSTKFGNQLSDIFGDDFHKQFYDRRNALAMAEQFEAKADSMKARVAAFVGEANDIEVLHLFQIPHVGWETDNDYGIFSINGVSRLFGTNHGVIEELDFADLQKLQKEISKTLMDIDKGLSILDIKTAFAQRFKV